MFHKALAKYCPGVRTGKFHSPNQNNNNNNTPKTKKVISALQMRKRRHKETKRHKDIFQECPPGIAALRKDRKFKPTYQGPISESKKTSFKCDPSHTETVYTRSYKEYRYREKQPTVVLRRVEVC